MRTPWYQKFFEALMAGFAVGGILAMALEVIPESLLRNYYDYMEPIYLGIQVALPLLFAIVYTIVWHRKVNSFPSGDALNRKRHTVLRGILRYWLAMQIATYGFAKLLKTQFQDSITTADMRVGELNGFQLTWNYFGYSYTFAVIIGLVQIFGAILLLFRRTTLLGTLILLPVMLNILLINVFYDIALGAFINSALFTLGLLYLLLLQWPSIKQVLFRPIVEGPDVIHPVLNHVLRFLSIGLAFGLIYSFVYNQKPSPLTGIWKINNMVKNRTLVDSSAWISDTSAWKKMYVEQYNSVAFCSNPYLLDKNMAKWGRLEQDPKDNKRFNILFWKKEKGQDTMKMVINKQADKNLWVTAYLSKDTIEMQMEKASK